MSAAKTPESLREIADFSRTMATLCERPSPFADGSPLDVDMIAAASYRADAERCGQAAAELENVVIDLVALVVRLAHALQLADTQHPLPKRAIAFLYRAGLRPEPLRQEPAT